MFHYAYILRLTDYCLPLMGPTNTKRNRGSELGGACYATLHTGGSLRVYRDDMFSTET